METDSFKLHYEKHIIQKVRSEIYDRYITDEKWDGGVEQRIVNSLKKLTIPYMDFSITTKCTLRCRDCTQWAPYIPNKRIFLVSEIQDWLERMFILVEECIFITLLGGEPFLHPQICEVLKLFVDYQNRGKILYLRIVTNGTVVPDKETLKLCAENNIYILISDYNSVLNNKMKENRLNLLHDMDACGCKYYFGKDASWIDLGIPNKECLASIESVNEDELMKRFNSCFIRDCVAFFEGQLYRCPRVYVMEANNWCSAAENEKIDFNRVCSEEELSRKIRRFYSVSGLRTCALCNAVKCRKQIKPAIQMEDADYERYADLVK